MSDIDIEALLAEVDPDSPSGEDMEYEAAFLEMGRALNPPHQGMIEGDAPAPPPEWRVVRRKASEVLGQSKDLRAGAALARALLDSHGLGGFRDGLIVLVGLCTRFWDTVHPQLDPDDGDPAQRVFALESVAKNDPDRVTDGVLFHLQRTPLVNAKGVGRYSLRDMHIASGEAKPTAAELEKGEPANSDVIHSAFMAVDLEDLTATAEAVTGGLEAIAALEAGLLEHLEPASTPDFSALTTTLKDIHKALAEPLQERGVLPDQVEEASEGSCEDGAETQRLTGEITSREDVTRAIDKICDFYRRTEPSSPIPILLRRAKRLVTMDFLELVKDLAPSGVSEIEHLRGPEE